LATLRADAKAGKSMEISKETMLITTNNSINVKADLLNLVDILGCILVNPF
jgi:hypothetical protein